MVTTTCSGPVTPRPWLTRGMNGPGGYPVVVRGTDRTMWWTIAELTLGRGGKFIQQPDAHLGYHRSRREPRIYVTTSPALHPIRPETNGFTEPVLPPSPHLLPLGITEKTASEDLFSILVDLLVTMLSRGRAPVKLADVRRCLLPAMVVFSPPARDRYQGLRPSEVHRQMLRDIVGRQPGDESAVGWLHAACLAGLDCLAHELRTYRQPRGALTTMVTSLRTTLRSGLPSSTVPQLVALADNGIVRFVGEEYAILPEGGVTRLCCSAYPHGVYTRLARAEGGQC